MTTTPYAPLSYDLVLNSHESNVTLGELISGKIHVERLIDVDPELFGRVHDEVMGIVSTDGGQVLGEGHTTFDYISKWDPNWKPKPGLIRQYSLFNTKDDLHFFGEDHHWFESRRFNPGLKAVPEFFARYFGDSELQNFRIQAIAGGGDLGQHRERIVAIPNREQHYKLRFHLPIITNPGVHFLMEGETYRMQAGSVFLFNQYCMHGVSNDGTELRVHLVFDCYLNDFIVQSLIAPAVSRSAA
ncbi:MAG: aspartyl/asparaginyl beta-hydroxylase domain-containing protein [Vicinamibacterales bacterium]